LEILANLLELRAGDLLGFSTKDLMKKVLGLHKKLPLDFLFSSTKRYTDVEEDQWIPLFPKGGEPLREQSLQIDPTPARLLIASSHFDKTITAMLLIFETVPNVTAYSIAGACQA